MSVQTFYIRMIILFFFFLTDYVPKVILKKTTKKQPMNPKSKITWSKKGIISFPFRKKPNVAWYSFSKDKQNQLIPGHTLVLLRQLLSWVPQASLVSAWSEGFFSTAFYWCCLNLQNSLSAQLSNFRFKISAFEQRPSLSLVILVLTWQA